MVYSNPGYIWCWQIGHRILIIALFWQYVLLLDHKFQNAMCLFGEVIIGLHNGHHQLEYAQHPWSVENGIPWWKFCAMSTVVEWRNTNLMIDWWKFLNMKFKHQLPIRFHCLWLPSVGQPWNESELTRSWDSHYQCEIGELAEEVNLHMKQLWWNLTILHKHLTKRMLHKICIAYITVIAVRKRTICNKNGGILSEYIILEIFVSILWN